MGSWSVLSVTCRHSQLNTTIHFGTDWYVTYKIKYTPTASRIMKDNFVEPPKMAWDEVILFVDTAKGEFWQFAGNLYTQKPDSPTMAVWAQRYFRAYLHAHKQPDPDSRSKGHSKLFDINGSPVSGAALGTHHGGQAQNKAVQEYLRARGGILEIEVHDIPALLKPGPGKVSQKERILAFNCGVTGIGPRVQAWQHLKMDSNMPESSWTYNFQLNGNPPGVKTTGLKTVPDPTPKGDLLPTDGIW